MTKRKNQIIQQLLEYGIIKFNFKQPITFKSGVRSPIYCNFRECANYPNLMEFILEELKEMYQSRRTLNMAMGVHSGAATYAERLGHILQVPTAYVRPGQKIKDYGMRNLIEGASVSHQKVFLVEDLVSTGDSLLQDALSIKTSGATEVWCVSLFSYCFKGVQKSFEENGLDYTPMLTIHDMLPFLEKKLSSQEYVLLTDWVSDPQGWFDRHKLTFDFGYLTTLRQATAATGSIICMGLDPVIEALPQESAKHGIIGFADYFRDLFAEMQSRNILPGAFKPNEAFYTKFNSPRVNKFDGYRCLTQIFEIIEESGIPLILDAKRGDIGNTSKSLAESYFDGWEPDALTVHGYMGFDSIGPFNRYCNPGQAKGVYILDLTSNPGSNDFQKQRMQNGKFLYELVAGKIIEWANAHPGVGFVAGATNTELTELLKMFAGKGIPGLIPGVGAQGATVADVMSAVNESGYESDILRINSSSGITHPWYKKQDDEIPSKNECIDLSIQALAELNQQVKNFLPI